MDTPFKGYVKGLTELAEVAIPINDGDYQEDECYFCGRCHTPKEIYITLFGMKQKVRCLCTCMEKEKQKAIEEEQSKRQAEIIAYNKAHCFAEKTLLDYNFQNCEKTPSLEKLSRFAEHFTEFSLDGEGLLLYGDVGTGKTYGACCVLNYLLDRGYKCLFTSTSRIVNESQKSFEEKQQYLDSLSSYNIVVIDDLSVERDSEYVNEIVYGAIDSLYKKKVPMIITTNLTCEQMKNPSSIDKSRIYSRITEVCVPIKVDGINRRKDNAKKRFNHYKEILG